MFLRLLPLQTWVFSHGTRAHSRAPASASSNPKADEQHTLFAVHRYRAKSEQLKGFKLCHLNPRTRFWS